MAALMSAAACSLQQRAPSSVQPLQRARGLARVQPGRRALRSTASISEALTNGASLASIGAVAAAGLIYVGVQSSGLTNLAESVKNQAAAQAAALKGTEDRLASALEKAASAQAAALKDTEDRQAAALAASEGRLAAGQAASETRLEAALAKQAAALEKAASAQAAALKDTEDRLAAGQAASEGRQAAAMSDAKVVLTAQQAASEERVAARQAQAQAPLLDLAGKAVSALMHNNALALPPRAVPQAEEADKSDHDSGDS